ncbi:MAG: hypothetical protein NTW18_04970 [Candidatus Omnitrophica bacterium]|nr:hypothetical protein [Candidatus Omnitrophota bacterium]
MCKKIFLFFLVLNLGSFFNLSPLFCADKQEQEQKIAEKKAFLKSEKEIAFLKWAELRQEYKEKEARDIENAPLGSSVVADYICDTGIAAYKSGEYEEALWEFNRALLVEPDNKTAKKYIENALYKMEQKPEKP